MDPHLKVLLKLILKSKIILFSVLFFISCISSFANRKFPGAEETTTIYPIQIENITESINFIQIKWKNKIHQRIVEKFSSNYNNELTEEVNFSYSCIPKNNLKEIYYVLNFPSQKCSNSENIQPIQNLKTLVLGNSIYVNGFNLILDIPMEKFPLQAAIADYNVKHEVTREKIANVLLSTSYDRIYLVSESKRKIVFKLKHFSDNGNEYAVFKNEEWHTSDDYWIEDSISLNFKKVNIQNSIIVVFKENYYSEKNNLENKNLNLFIIESNSYQFNQNLLVSSYSVSKKSKLGFGKILYPITLPLDIILFPFQVIYFGYNYYYFIFSCFFEISCKTSLG